MSGIRIFPAGSTRLSLGGRGITITPPPGNYVPPAPTPLAVTDNGDGSYLVTGTPVVDNGDGSFTVTDSGVTDLGGGSYTIAA